jgi:hypothetical protein
MRLIDQQEIRVERWDVDNRLNSNPHGSEFGQDLGVSPQDPLRPNTYYVNIWNELIIEDMITNQSSVNIRTHSSFRIEVLPQEQLEDRFFFTLIERAHNDFNNLLRRQLAGTNWNALQGEELSFDESQGDIRSCIDMWQRTLRMNFMN